MRLAVYLKALGEQLQADPPMHSLLEMENTAFSGLTDSGRYAFGFRPHDPADPINWPPGAQSA